MRSPAKDKFAEICWRFADLQTISYWDVLETLISSQREQSLAVDVPKSCKFWHLNCKGEIGIRAALALRSAAYGVLQEVRNGKL